MIVFEISQYWQDCKNSGFKFKIWTYSSKEREFCHTQDLRRAEPLPADTVVVLCSLKKKKAKPQTTRTLKEVLVQKWRFSVVLPNDCFLRGIIFIACMQFFNPAQSPQDRWGHDKSQEVCMILLDWIIFNSASSHHLSISCFFQTTGERNKTPSSLVTFSITQTLLQSQMVSKGQILWVWVSRIGEEPQITHRTRLPLLEEHLCSCYSLCL